MGKSVDRISDEDPLYPAAILVGELVRARSA